MANYRGHLAGGFVGAAVYTAVMLFVPVKEFAEYANLLHGWQAVAGVLIIAMLFGLFPDVDTNSKAQDIFYGFVFPLDAALIWNGNIHAAAFLGLIAMLPILTHHRGWTHAKWAAFLVPLPILLVPYIYDGKMLAISLVYYGAAVVGYLSHLLLDGLLTRHFRIRE